MMKIMLIIVVIIVINSPFQPGDFSTGTTIIKNKKHISGSTRLLWWLDVNFLDPKKLSLPEITWKFMRWWPISSYKQSWILRMMSVGCFDAFLHHSKWLCIKLARILVFWGFFLVFPYRGIFEDSVLKQENAGQRKSVVWHILHIKVGWSHPSFWVRNFSLRISQFVSIFP